MESLNRENIQNMDDSGRVLGSQKSSLRLQYEAQVEVIKNQVGDLEFVRSQLSLSQRKISQLLLIDPSNWSRWVKDPEKIPPLAWRALQWYLALNDKIPGLNAQYFLSQNTQSTMNKSIENLKKKQKNIDQFETLFHKSFEKLDFENLEQKNQIKEQQKRLKKAYFFLIILGILNLGLAFLLLKLWF